MNLHCIKFFYFFIKIFLAIRSSLGIPLIIVGSLDTLVTFCDSTSDEVSLPETIIQSPNYPDEYDNNVDCIVKVKLNEGDVVSLEILDFHVHESFECENDFLEIRDGENQEAKLITRICGSYGSTHFKASGNTMLLRFHSNGDSTAKGFKVKIKIGIPLNLFQIIEP